MNIQLVGPICGTGYGLATAHLTWALQRIFGEKIRLWPMGEPDTRWLKPEVEEAVVNAISVETDYMQRKIKPDYTFCVWHEWDHPPVSMEPIVPGEFADKYIAMPTFELDQVRPEAVQALQSCYRVMVSS